MAEQRSTGFFHIQLRGPRPLSILIYAAAREIPRSGANNQALHAQDPGRQAGVPLFLFSFVREVQQRLREYGGLSRQSDPPAFHAAEKLAAPA